MGLVCWSPVSFLLVITVHVAAHPLKTLEATEHMRSAGICSVMCNLDSV